MPYLLDHDVFFAALYEGHVTHVDGRGWLDANKPSGCAIAMETYLAAMRPLMNPTILGRSTLDGEQARRVVETELAGEHLWLEIHHQARELCVVEIGLQSVTDSYRIRPIVDDLQLVVHALPGDTQGFFGDRGPIIAIQPVRNLQR